MAAQIFETSSEMEKLWRRVFDCSGALVRVAAVEGRSQICCNYDKSKCAPFEGTGNRLSRLGMNHIVVDACYARATRRILDESGCGNLQPAG